LALADVAVADDPALVHEHQRRPPAHGVTVPDREVVVLHDRVLDAQLAHRIDDLVERLLPAELGTVHADDGQALRRVLAVPVPQLRDHVFAVVSAERPELDGDDAAAEALDAQRCAVDPLAGRELRRRPAGRRLGTGPARRSSWPPPAIPTVRHARWAKGFVCSGPRAPRARPS